MTTTATTSIRSTFKAWLVKQLADSLDPEGIPVDHGWPGRKLERDHVWIDRVAGDVELPFIMDGRKYRNDNFTVWVLFQASAPGDSCVDTDFRAEAMYGHLEDLLANDPGIEDMAGIIEVSLGHVEGPSGELKDDGAVSIVVAEVAVQSQLT